MQLNAAFHKGLHCKGEKDLQTKENNIFENYNLTPLDIYNGRFQVYCTKTVGRTH